MSKIIQYFKEITQIPHCSKETEKLMDYLVDFANKRGYCVEVDEAKNIHIFKGRPRLCLQAHYDMVCMGKAPHIETYINADVMRAKESSLGADNGMAIAMMMVLMDEGKELEFLFTADEEIGLIGANALDFKLYAEYMLNLDSEDEAEVYIGCAGGADITAYRNFDLFEGEGKCYEVAVKGLVGGHSGVDIDKGIPSAITLLAKYLDVKDIDQLATLYAGERRNSIPANAVAVVRSREALNSDAEVMVRELGEAPMVYMRSVDLIEVLHRFETGVRVYNEKLGIPHTSINLAIVTADENGKVTIETSARAMEKDALEALIDETVSFFETHGFTCVVEDKYPAWKPDITEFTNIVEEKMREVYGKSECKAIHAGLECGVIAQKYPDMKFASIGPTIRYPHSTREEVDLNSVDKTYKVLKRIVETF